MARFSSSRMSGETNTLRWTENVRFLQVLDDQAAVAVAVGMAVFVGMIEHVGLQRCDAQRRRIWRFLYIYPLEASTAT